MSVADPGSVKRGGCRNLANLGEFLNNFGENRGGGCLLRPPPPSWIRHCMYSFKMNENLLNFVVWMPINESIKQASNL